MPPWDYKQKHAYLHGKTVRWLRKEQLFIAPTSKTKQVSQLISDVLLSACFSLEHRLIKVISSSWLLRPQTFNSFFRVCLFIFLVSCLTQNQYSNRFINAVFQINLQDGFSSTLLHSPQCHGFFLGPAGLLHNLPASPPVHPTCLPHTTQGPLTYLI